MRRTYARSPLHGWILVLFLIAVAMRVATMLLYQVSVFQFVDSARLTRAGGWPGFFSDYWMPAGYASFAIVLRFISDHLWVLIGVQHLLGLATGLALMGTARRLGAPLALAVVPAAVVWFGGDFMYLEHLVMNDSFYLFAAALALYVSARAIEAVNDWRWWVAAGGALAAVGLVRTTGLVLPFVVAGWVAAFLPTTRRIRARAAGTVLGSTVAIVGVYLIVASAVGPYDGITNMGGFNLYARVAPFADCHEFTPPAGTAPLCEKTPPGARPGPFFYTWDARSPAWVAYGGATPHAAAMTGPFAQAAILNQPLDYLHAVVNDLGRYVDPDLTTPRPYNGTSTEVLQYSYRDRAVEKEIIDSLDPVYARPAMDVTAPKLLTAYQRSTRLEGLIILGLALVVMAGALLGRGPARRGTWLVGAVAFLLYLAPVAAISYDARYAIPPQAFLATAAALAIAALASRLSGGREVDTHTPGTATPSEPVAS